MQKVGRLDKPEVIDDSKDTASSRHNGADTHANSETVTSHKKICTGSD